MRSLFPAILLALGVMPQALAHEFWLQPAPALDRTLITALQRHAVDGRHDELALDTRAKSITLPADQFTSYLREEGLESVIATRERTGQSTAPGRERYARCVKTLVRVGPRSDGTFAVSTGQHLELTPLADPFAVRPGGRLSLRVTFAGQPLAQALVQAWHRKGDQLLRTAARTAADGTVAFDLPQAGEWMFSLVHMVPVTDEPAHDWQSFWGNLTFTLPAS